MFFIFSVSLFCISLLQPLSLQEPLSLDEAQQYSAKKVRVTGFLYSLPTGEQLIGNQPNLRSCCIGSVLTWSCFVSRTISITSLRRILN